jgi:hypothetical protein
MNPVTRRRSGHSAASATLASSADSPGNPGVSRISVIGSMIVGAGLVDMIVFADLITRDIVRGAVVNEASLIRICAAGLCFIGAIVGGAAFMRKG